MESVCCALMTPTQKLRSRSTLTTFRTLCLGWAGPPARYITSVASPSLPTVALHLFPPPPACLLFPISVTSLSPLPPQFSRPFSPPQDLSHCSYHWDFRQSDFLWGIIVLAYFFVVPLTALASQILTASAYLQQPSPLWHLAILTYAIR